MDTKVSPELQAQLDRIEMKLDEMLLFRDTLMQMAAPFMNGNKGRVWMAMLAKSKGGSLG